MVYDVWQVHRIKETVAVVASGGANGAVAQIGPLGFEGRIRSLQYVPTGADWPSAVASSRNLRVVNGGTNAAGTVVLASVDNVGTVNISSIGSGKAGTVVYAATGASAGSGTFGANHVLLINQITVGGTAAATTLPAGYVELLVEINRLTPSSAT